MGARLSPTTSLVHDPNRSATMSDSGTFRMTLTPEQKEQVRKYDRERR